MVYDRKRIAWELERTAMGDGYYGNALYVAKELPEATPIVRSLLDRWATGKQEGLSDRADLCAFALQVYVSTPNEYTKNNYTDEMLAPTARKQALAQQHAPSATEGVERLLQRIDAAIERVTTGRAAMRIPADPTDPDLVLADARNWIKQAALAQQPAAVDGVLTPTGTFCSICEAPQHNTPSGVSCPSGHGGAEPLATQPGGES